VPGRNATGALLALALLLTATGPALAYVGPGAGLEMVGYFFSLLAWMAAVFCAVMLYPVYALLRWLRGKGAPAPGEAVAVAPGPQHDSAQIAP
jgi:hypothetical protein